MMFIPVTAVPTPFIPSLSPIHANAITPGTTPNAPLWYSCSSSNCAHERRSEENRFDKCVVQSISKEECDTVVVPCFVFCHFILFFFQMKCNAIVSSEKKHTVQKTYRYDTN